MMQQADDFLSESEALAALIGKIPDAGWQRATQFKGWTVNDVIVHLHFWNRAADLSLNDPPAFKTLMTEVFARVPQDGMRSVENETVAPRGPALREAWVAQFRDMAVRWRGLDPKQRVAWAGPDMSVRSSITARQMETWAHGQAIFDLFGAAREEKDRLRNIVVLGVNTFRWSHKVQGLEVPALMPRLRLFAPSGEIWEFGDPSDHELIEGTAVDFARVVTQVRNVADTGLRVTGPAATRWMATAQCFAGGRESPPPPGTRYRQRS